MEVNFIFQSERGEKMVPVNKELYISNLDYFQGMGIYSMETCQEKALLTTGYRILPPNGFEGR